MELLKKTAVFLEIRDRRDDYLAKSLAEDGLNLVLLSKAQDAEYKDYKKIYIRSVLSEVTLDEAKAMENGSLLFSRALSGDVKRELNAKGIEYYNILADETFIVKNAHVTAEGALGHIIFNTDSALKRMPVLVLGYGRVGKAVTKILTETGACVSVATDDPVEFAIASFFSDEITGLSEMVPNLGKFTAIVNTVPKLILEGEKLKLIDKDCFILDLASSPGGVDFAAAKDLGLRCMHALGVPGRTAPKTAGLYIKDIIMEKLKYKI